MICARSSSFKVLLNKVTAQNISISDNVGATDDVNNSMGQVFTKVVSFPAAELATNGYRVRPCPSGTSLARGKDNTGTYPATYWNHMIALQGKQRYETELGFVLQGEQKLNTPKYSSDVSSDLTEWTGAWVTEREWAGSWRRPRLFACPSQARLHSVGAHFMSWDFSFSPLNCMWTLWAEFFWALWVRTSQVLWSISVSVYGSRMWVRKDLYRATRHNLGATGRHLWREWRNQLTNVSVKVLPSST